MRFFNNLKLSTKLVGGFGIVLLLFTCVMAIYHITVQSTSSNFQNLMEVNVAIASQVTDIKTLMKQCRIDEKNFLSSLDTKYLKQLEENINNLALNAQNIVKKAQYSQNSITAQQAEDISDYIDNYSKSFITLSQSYEIRGLDVKSGLRGEFATAADTLVREMAYVDVEDVYIQMLRIVQAQNRCAADNFNQEQIDIIDKLLSDYADVIEKSNANEQMIKTLLREVLSDYRESFEKMKSQEGLDEKMLYFKQMQSAFVDIDEVFNISYLPNAKSMPLEIRSKEKDYLLFGGQEYAAIAHQSITNLFTAIEKSDIGEDYRNNSIKYLTAYKQAFDNLIKEDFKIEKLYAKMSDAVNNVEPLIEELYANAQNIAKKGAEDVIVKCL